MQAVRRSPFAVRPHPVGPGSMPFRSPAAMVTEGTWIRALHADGGVVVPRVVAPAADEPFAVADADGIDRGCLVLSWVTGCKMRRRFAPHHAGALGSAAAHLHRHALSFDPPPKGWAKDWGASDVCGSGGRDDLDEVAGPEASAAVAAIEEAVAAAFHDLAGEGRSLVNGDLGPHNVVWHHRTPGLFDFNDLGEGYHAWDLARYLHGLRWRSSGPALVKAALDGYQEVRPLPAGFVEYGRLLEVAAGLILAHYLASRVEERGEEAVQTVRRLVDAAQQHLEDPAPATGS
jgi:Ser/Thr protein kinase RdoA (MazF antagonist)